MGTDPRDLPREGRLAARRTEPLRTQTLLLVRHGRTALNAADRLRGLADPPLDGVGIAEASAVAEALARYRPDHIASSPLRRAVETGRIIASAANATFACDTRFTDRDYGRWTGVARSEVIARWGSVDAAPGIEARRRVLARVLPALGDLLDAHVGEVVALVSHEAVIRPLLRAIDPALPPLELPTASWNRLIRQDGRWSVEEVDRTARAHRRRTSRPRIPI